jgi:hypothetical protein
MFNKKQYMKKYLKKYYQLHKKELNESRREYRKIYQQEHKLEIDTKNKLYRETHKTEHRRANKRWRINHKKEINAYMLKRKKDLNFKILCYLRNRVWCALNRNEHSIHTRELLGCSIEFLRIWLELQFKEGMNWFNYGKKGWVIDHVRPCVSFNLTNIEEQKICFHYTNLQPLWDLENSLKGVKT